jgi:hypothetical protein
MRFTGLYPGAGNHYFVSSVTGSAATGYGYTVDAPISTLDAAIGLCTADKGDVIHVLPGHAETIVGAAGVALDVAGVTVVGYGNGRNRPTFTFTTATAASFDISAANCRVQGLNFINGIDAQTAMVNITAANVSMEDCEFMTADATTQTVVGILGGAGADRCTLKNLWMHGSADAGTTSAISMGATDDTLIEGCRIDGAHSTTGSILNSAAAINFNVIGCTVVNGSADGDNKCVIYHASTTGLIANNRFACIDSTSPNPFTCAAAYVSGNYFTGAVSTTASTLK